jgi:hypothetical protein
LHLERGFTQDAAKRFLTVYDETIDFASLKPSDKLSPEIHKPPVIRGGMGNTGGEAMTQDSFGLDEGQAVLQWPTNLSAESVVEFEAWLMLIISRAKRKANKLQQTKESNEAD